MIRNASILMNEVKEMVQGYRMERMAVLLVVFLPLLTVISSCGSPENTDDYNVPTYNELMQSLEGKTEVMVFGNAGGPQMLITPELGARILGVSFAGANDENLMWVDKTLMDGSYWTTTPRFWNAGGFRTWIAPEDLFYLDKDDNWFVPAALDPVTYELVSKRENGADFTMDADLDTRDGRLYKLTFKRSLSLLEEPPAEVAVLSNDVEYVGVVTKHSLVNRGNEVIGEDLPYVCLWALLQIEPSGTTLVPLKDGADPETAYREYFNPLGERLVVQDNIISVKIDGKYRSKIGIRPEAAKNGVVFLRDHGDGTGVLYALLFPVDPDGIYVDKPWGTDSDYGDAIELYNDDGNMGGFNEIECHGPAQKLANGESQSHESTLHIFGGKVDTLKKIAGTLLDTDISNAKFF